MYDEWVEMDSNKLKLDLDVEGGDDVGESMDCEGGGSSVLVDEREDVDAEYESDGENGCDSGESSGCGEFYLIW